MKLAPRFHAEPIQTLLFLQAKNDPKKPTPHGTLLKHVKAQFVALGLTTAGDDLATTVAALGTSEYMTWTRMADKVAYWNKRFCQALLVEKG